MLQSFIDASSHNVHGGTVISLLLSLNEACSGCNNNKPIDTGSIASEPYPFCNNWGQWMDMGQLSDGSAAFCMTQPKALWDLQWAEMATALGFTKDDGYPNDQGLDEGDRGKYHTLAVADDGQVWVARRYRPQNPEIWQQESGSRLPQDGEWTVGVADTGGGGTPDAGPTLPSAWTVKAIR